MGGGSGGYGDWFRRFLGVLLMSLDVILKVVVSYVIF